MEKPDKLVEHSYSRWQGNQHPKNKPRALQTVRPRRRHKIDSGEDDVRHEAKTSRVTYIRLIVKAIKDERVYEGSSWNGFLSMQI